VSNEGDCVSRWSKSAATVCSLERQIQGQKAMMDDALWHTLERIASEK